MNLADLREDYRRDQLEDSRVDANPLNQFEAWFREATGQTSHSRWRKLGVALVKCWSALLNHRPADINAMILATADRQGRPSTRTVLLKAVDERGFIFFTNYESRKAAELAANPHAALTFFWPELERQVCVAGIVTRLPVEESRRYFQSRPRGSQIGAWASNQSQIIPDRSVLEARWRELEKQFPRDVPLPPNWGGFVLRPDRIEFWQGRPSRVHDRFSYTRQPEGGWRRDRLSP